MARPAYPSDSVDKLLLRFPDGLRDRIREAAQDNGRSMNAEVVARLETWQALHDRIDADEKEMTRLKSIIAENQQPALIWESQAKSQKSYSDTMVLNLNNLSRLILDNADAIPDRVVQAAKRHFDFSEDYLQRFTKIKAMINDPAQKDN